MTVDRATETDGARRAYRALAAAATMLMLAVVVASAYLRHAHAGPSCEPWPGCEPRADAASAAAPIDAGVRAARVVLRPAAAAVTAAILGLLLVAFTQRPVWRREAFAASAALVVAGALAVLGIVTAGSRLPAVVLGNLVGGHLVVAACAYAWGLGSRSSDVAPRARALAFVSLIAALAAAATGASIVPRSAADPTLLHGIAAIVVVVPAAAAANAMRRERPKLAAALASSVAVALTLGVAIALTRPTPSLGVVHNGAAAASVALLAFAAARGSRAAARQA